MKTIVILISGRGSNMQAIVEAAIPGLQVAAVVSNRQDAAGLAWAATQGIATRHLDPKAYADRDSFDAALMTVIDGYQPDLVVLAGYMRILSDAFVHHYADRLLNIHPSLLPAFTGLHPHERALAEGVKLHGCTVHFVTPELDRGPIVIQAAVPVLADDTADTLAARVLQQEHRIYPQALRWFAEDRLTLRDNRVIITAARASTALTHPEIDC